MESVQEVLLRKSLNEELPERLAEKEVQEAKEKLEADKKDVEIIAQWHASKIHALMMKLDLRKESRYSEALFCEEASEKGIEQQVSHIVKHKPSLVAAWYENKHGLSHVRFERRYQCHKAKLLWRWHMKFCFESAEIEAKLTKELTVGSRAYIFNVNLALALLKPTLPVKLAEMVMQFIPDYIGHLKQQKLRFEQAPRW